MVILCLSCVYQYHRLLTPPINNPFDAASKPPRSRITPVPSPPPITNPPECVLSKPHLPKIQIQLYLILSGVPICLAEFSAGQIGIRRTQKGSNSHTRTPPSPSLLVCVKLTQILQRLVNFLPDSCTHMYITCLFRAWIFGHLAWAVGIISDRRHDNASSRSLPNIIKCCKIEGPG